MWAVSDFGRRGDMCGVKCERRMTEAGCATNAEEFDMVARERVLVDSGMGFVRWKKGEGGLCVCLLNEFGYFSRNATFHMRSPYICETASGTEDMVAFTSCATLFVRLYNLHGMQAAKKHRHMCIGTVHGRLPHTCEVVTHCLHLISHASQAPYRYFSGYFACFVCSTPLYACLHATFAHAIGADAKTDPQDFICAHVSVFPRATYLHTLGMCKRDLEEYDTGG